MKGSGFLQTTTITPPPPNPPAVAVVRQGVAAAEARRDPAGGHTCESHAMETTYHGARVCRALLALQGSTQRHLLSGMDPFREYKLILKQGNSGNPGDSGPLRRWIDAERFKASWSSVFEVLIYPSFLLFPVSYCRFVPLPLFHASFLCSFPSRSDCSVQSMFVPPVSYCLVLLGLCAVLSSGFAGRLLAPCVCFLGCCFLVRPFPASIRDHLMLNL